MKRIFSLILAMMFSIAIASAQDELYAIYDKLQTNRVSISFSCIFNAETPFEIQGNLLVQGNSFFLSSSGYEIRSNAGTCWISNPSSKEVYIENARGLEELGQYWEMLSDLKILNVKYLPIDKDMSPFVMDVSKLDSSWAVTDMR